MAVLDGQTDRRTERGGGVAMNEIDALSSIAESLAYIRSVLMLINVALWLILMCKDCHGSTHNVADAIKELTNHLRSRR